MNGGRKTVAVLIDHVDHFSSGYEMELRTGFDAACREHDFNLLIVVGRALDSPMDNDSARNRVYELLNRDCTDGIILAAAGLANFTGPDRVRRLAEACRPLPLCSLGVEIPGVPSIVVDNRPGMEAVVEHLLRQHGCRRVAFIGGPRPNPDAVVRFNAYRQVLARWDVRFDPELYVDGFFTPASGADATRELLERGVDFDAVVAANDGMAQGAIELLRSRGKRVPRDVLVTGFDDLPSSRFNSPPLTTVRQPFQRLARGAVELLRQQMQGGSVPQLSMVPVELVSRTSCGCDGPRENAAPRVRTIPPEVWLEVNAERLTARLKERISLPGSSAGVWADQIVSGVRAELAGLRGAFVSTLESLLERVGDHDEIYEELQAVITVLRDEFDASGLEELWHSARRVISLANTYRQAQERATIEAGFMRLLRSGERFSGAWDLPSLKRALSEELPHTMRNAFISLYPQGSRGPLEPFFYLHEGVCLDVEAQDLPQGQLLPPELRQGSRRHTSFVLPIVLESECAGVALFEFSTGAGVHEMYCEQISAALRSIALHEAVLQKTKLHERSVQERTAASKRMNSLSVLAGGVAHDLNNALGPLVALPDIILQELSDVRNGKDDAELRCDVRTIRTAGMRAAQTIKDLLTLARQGRTHKDVIDLNQVVAASLHAESPRERGQRPQSELKLHPEPLVIRAFEPHLVRAISNLVRNAAEAMDDAGCVVIATRLARLVEPLLGYETVEPGEYAEVRVTDTGSGIPPQEMQRIFEPFFTKKKLSDNSGSGLGLAIVHGVVKEHDGFVDVRSEPGSGTTFTLYFPLTREVVQNRAEVRGAPRGSDRLLVVDDDPVQLRTAQRVLGALGYQVTTLSSGTLALKQFSDAKVAGANSSPYQLVIVDMLLGEALDGLAVFERLRRLFPEQRGLIASGHAPMDRGRLADELGLCWLSKPYTSEGLARAVAAALAPKPAADAEPKPNRSSERPTGT